MALVSAALGLVSVVLYLYDVVSDCLLAQQHFSNENTLAGILTIVFITGHYVVAGFLIFWTIITADETSPPGIEVKEGEERREEEGTKLADEDEGCCPEWRTMSFMDKVICVVFLGPLFLALASPGIAIALVFLIPAAVLIGVTMAFAICCFDFIMLYTEGCLTLCCLDYAVLGPYYPVVRGLLEASLESLPQAVTQIVFAARGAKVNKFILVQGLVTSILSLFWNAFKLWRLTREAGMTLGAYLRYLSKNWLFLFAEDPEESVKKQPSDAAEQRSADADSHPPDLYPPDIESGPESNPPPDLYPPDVSFEESSLDKDHMESERRPAPMAKEGILGGWKRKWQEAKSGQVTRKARAAGIEAWQKEWQKQMERNISK